VALALVDRADADERLAELARHFAEAAALGEVDRAVEWGRRAGDAAMAELAWEEAATHYGRALDALDVAEDADPLVRCDLLLSSGRALKAVSDPRAEDVLARASELARAHDDPARRADATLLLCGQRFDREPGEVDERRVAQIEGALDALADSDPGRRALLLSAQAGELLWSGDAAQRRGLADEALELARGTGDREVLGQVLNQRGYVFDSAQLGGIDEYLAAQGEVIELAGDLDDQVLLCRSFLARSPVLTLRGHRQQAEADLRDAEALVARLRQPTLEHRAMVLRAASTLLSGRLAEAEELSSIASAFAQQHGLPDASAAHAYRLHFERGTLDELEPLFAELAEAQPTIHIIRTGLLGVYTTTDRYEEAGVHLRALAADDWAMVPTDGTWIVTIAGAARTAGIIGDLEIAARAYELARPHTDQLAYTGQSFEQPVALSVGTAAMALGRHAEAEALFAEAVELCEAAEAPTFVAATRAQWAELCLARNDPGDHERAQELAAQALETAKALKLGRVEVLSQRVLDRL
jgi:tetratricopeptide (TPR) repeat protein